MITCGAERASIGNVFGLEVRDKINVIADELIAAALWISACYET